MTEYKYQIVLFRPYYFNSSKSRTNLDNTAMHLTNDFSGAGPTGVPDGHHEPHSRQLLLLHRAGQWLRLHLHPHGHLLLHHHHDHCGLRRHLPHLRWQRNLFFRIDKLEAKSPSPSPKSLKVKTKKEKEILAYGLSQKYYGLFEGMGGLQEEDYGVVHQVQEESNKVVVIGPVGKP